MTVIVYFGAYDRTSCIGENIYLVNDIKTLSKDDRTLNNPNLPLKT